MKKGLQIKCPECGASILVGDQLREAVRKEFLLEIKGKEKLITDLKDRLEEALRKASQMPNQVKGELMEQSIMDVLRSEFPDDEITQTAKATNGADVLQTVKLPNGKVCGQIYYESKNTKSWSNDWIPKLKNDNLSTKANVMVLVTFALPKGVQQCKLIDDVWVTSFEYFKDFSFVLRYSMIKLFIFMETQEYKESQKDELFKYITGDGFKSIFEAMLTGFLDMRASHDAEKLKIMHLWKERERIFDQIFVNAIELHGSLRSIAGSAIGEIPMLELRKAN